MRVIILSLFLGFIFSQQQVAARDFIQDPVAEKPYQFSNFTPTPRSFPQFIPAPLKPFPSFEVSTEFQLKTGVWVQPLRPEFVNENNGNSRIFQTAKVRYLAAEELKLFRVTIQDGKFYSANGKLLDTQNKSAIYIMNSQGELFVSLEHLVSAFGHSSLAMGAEVAGAGEIRVRNGILEFINNDSPQYRTSEKVFNQVLSMLIEHGVDPQNSTEVLLDTKKMLKDLIIQRNSLKDIPKLRRRDMIQNAIDAVFVAVGKIPAQAAANAFSHNIFVAVYSSQPAAKIVSVCQNYFR